MREDGITSYVYDVKNEMRRLNALIEKRGMLAATFRINEAFWKALEVKR